MVTRPIARAPTVASASQSLATSKQQNVFACFIDRGNDTSWRQFDWALLTTFCQFGSLEPELLCHAHAHGVRIVHGNGGITLPENRSNEPSRY